MADYAARVLLLDFTQRVAKWISADAMTERMREQEKRGVRFSSDGWTPSKRKHG